MRTLYLVFLLVLITFNSSLANKIQDEEAKTKAIYAQYCSSCHGEKIEAFVDRQWKHGKTKPEIIKSITNGVAEGGMPSWKTTLTKAQIVKMSDLIIKSLKNVEQYQFTTSKKQSTFKSGNMTITLDTIVTGLDSPWGFTQLPNQEYLVTDRAGSLYKIDKNKQKIIIKNTPSVLVKGQGGLLDVEIHPDYGQNGWVYLSYSKFKEENGTKLSTTAIIRGKIIDNSFAETQEIFEALPYTKTMYHYGSRIVFDGKGYMYFSVGERGMHFEYAQSTENDLGKIHKLYDDGRIPEDNPFYNKPPNKPSIFTFGNRNPQGLTYNTLTNQVWEHEHGPRGGDEINIIEKGVNYGWPVISYGINYDGKPITNITKKEGMAQPLTYFIPSIAPSGLDFLDSDIYPDWKGSLLIGSLRFNYLERCVVKDNKIVSQVKELQNVGRMRNVKVGADGYIYIGVENPGMVFKLVPSF